jgi:hypothetical protein
MVEIDGHAVAYRRIYGATAKIVAGSEHFGASTGPVIRARANASLKTSATFSTSAMTDA